MGGMEVAKHNNDDPLVSHKASAPKATDHSSAKVHPTLLTEKNTAKEAAKKNAEESKRREVAQFMDAGESAFSHGDFDGAIQAYSQALGVDGGVAGAWVGRGGAYLRKGYFQFALSDLDRAIHLDPDNLFASRDRADARLKTGDIDGAIADYDRKLTLAPGDGRALCGRGEARLKRGDREGAITDFGLADKLKYPGAAQLLADAEKGKLLTTHA